MAEEEEIAKSGYFGHCGRPYDPKTKDNASKIKNQKRDKKKMVGTVVKVMTRRQIKC